MSVFTRLETTKPAWVSSFVRTDQYIDIECRPVRRSGTQTRAYNLRITSSGTGGAKIAEREDARLLPSCCVERHINADTSFCISFGSTSPLATEEAAGDWWNQLAAFLINQEYAHQHRRWPLRGGLSHGNAAHTQIKMEDIAEPLGWKTEVLLAIFRSEGWLSGILPRRTKDRTSLVNARSTCPRGCTWKHKLMRKRSCEQADCFPACKKQHRSIVRADCPHRQEVEALVLLEYVRRKEEQDVIQGLVEQNISCCGTMNHCGLKIALDKRDD